MLLVIANEYSKLEPWQKALIGGAMIALSIVITVATAGAALGPQAALLGGKAMLLSMAAKAALVELAVGVGFAVIGWVVISAITGNWSLDALTDSVADAIFFTGLFMFISSAVNGIKQIARSSSRPHKKLAECSSKCFLAGTIVHCENGTKKIEDVEVGDKVLAYNEETGEQEYKTVVRLFRNESKNWVGVTVGDKEIVSTLGHKYYLPETKQWISADNLDVGDSVLLSDGSYAEVQSVRTICYETSQTTYNFEVEDFHTYYVASGVLVHNECWTWGNGSHPTSEESLIKHTERHALELGLDPTDTAAYFKKAKNFADTVVQRGIKKARFVDGATPNIFEYKYLGKYIHMDKYNKIIVSFGIIT